MPVLEIGGKQYELNDDGFLLNSDEWTDEVARVLAQAEEGLNNLTEEHWAVINYIREYFLEKKVAPMVRKLCKHTGFSLKYIFELFPSGPAKGACKLAGLPKPDGCV